MIQTFFIKGMSCTSCANHIELAVRKLPINSCNVNLLLNEMVVDYDPILVISDDIINAVESVGYAASIQQYENQDKKKEIIFSICILIPLFLISMFIKNIISIFIQAILALIILYLNKDRIFNGLKGLVSLKPTMDSLITLGSITSYLYSVYLAFKGTKMLYFDASGMVLVFVSIGKYLEDKSKTKTTNALEALIKLTPKKAIKLIDNKQFKIDITEINVNDCLLIKPGSSIPVDGICIEGHSYIDTSSITGESLPVEVSVNTLVTSGTINMNNPITIKCLKPYKDSTFATIIDLVKNAANSKANISRLVDQISKIFIPTVIIISLLTGIIWFVLTKDLTKAFIHLVNCLVVSCPCSLGLATPTAIMVAIGVGAKNGIIFKEAKYIEELSKVNCLVFDKTGTITTGKHNVVEATTTDIDIIYKLESLNDHPLAKTICDYLKPSVSSDVHIDSYNYHVGLGIAGVCNNHVYYIGNAEFMDQNGISVKEDKHWFTSVYCARDDRLIGYFNISDTIRYEAQKVISYLKSKYELHLLSGDSSNTVNHMKEQLDFEFALANVLPNQKYDYIKTLQHNKTVCMIGDGINDTVALTQANVGIAISNSTDIAFEVSDVILTGNNLYGLINALNLSKLTIKIIKENLFWALGYNCILIPIAAGLLSNYKIELMPAYCAIAMSLSSFTVVSNALRINRFKPILNPYEQENNIDRYLIKIDTMTCEHCVKAVTNALLNLDIFCQCNLNDSTCTIYQNNPKIDLIIKEIEKAGYKVINITKI